MHEFTPPPTPRHDRKLQEATLNRSGSGGSEGVWILVRPPIEIVSPLETLTCI